MSENYRPMDCPNCGSPMEVILQVNPKEKAKPEHLIPSVHHCLCCNKYVDATN